MRLPLLWLTCLKAQRRLDVLQVGVGDVGQVGEESVKLWGQLVDFIRAQIDPHHLTRHLLHRLFRHMRFCGHGRLLSISSMGSQPTGDQTQTAACDRFGTYRAAFAMIAAKSRPVLYVVRFLCTGLLVAIAALEPSTTGAARE